MPVSAIHSELKHKIAAVFAALILAVTLFSTSSCSSGGEDISGLPSPLQDFIVRYFPGSRIDSYSHPGATYHVRIYNGPGLTFDSAYQWTSIEGYGMPLPQVLLFDQLPPALYAYLQETENLDSVFGIVRTPLIYTLTLLDSTITFDIDSERITTSFQRDA